MEKESWRRNHGKGIMARRQPGGTQEAPRMHPGDTQRHPGGTRRHQEHPGDQRPPGHIS